VLDSKLQQAVMLHRQGHLAPARMLYEQILQVAPQHFHALHLLGVVAAATGDPAQAAALIGRALEIVPDDAPAHNNRGAALHALGHWDAALACYDRAAALDPKYADPLYNRGNLFKDLSRWEEAVASYDLAICRRQEYAEAFCNRGICLAALERLDAALASYDRTIALQAAHPAAFYNRGNVLCKLRRWQEAVESYDRAIRLQPGYAEAHANRAFPLKELARIEEALGSCDRAVALNPKFKEAHVNRAGVLLSMKRTDEAIASYDQAIALDPADASAYVNRAMARLLAGDFAGGWSDYEWRWWDTSRWIIEEKRSFSQPLWLGGEPLRGRTILLHSEQGYGDTIQFCRYATLVAGLGAVVLLETPPALAGLMHSVAGVAQVIVKGAPLPPFDYHCPLLSLPLAMKTSLSTIPAAVPYLEPGEDHRRRWRERLGARRARRVGLVWSGGFRPSRPELWSANERRNIPLAVLGALDAADVEFYSLQKGQPAESEVAALSACNWRGPKMRDLTRDIRDFGDTAAFIEQLDLVISVDTATAHLAGALGKPVWILNRYDGCWRWLLERSDSPWYPTARLYRQERAGDWVGVVERVNADLAAFCVSP
jgi:tetratricopeptide (TPR) repeat protein